MKKRWNLAGRNVQFCLWIRKRKGISMGGGEIWFGGSTRIKDMDVLNE